MPPGIRWKGNRAVGFLLLLVGFVWILTTLNTSLYSMGGVEDKSSREIQAEILGLSERYVKQLARETQNTVDGPFAARLTGYDLKKTMAVLLEDLMGRMEKMEDTMNYLNGNSSGKTRNLLPVLEPEGAEVIPAQKHVGFQGLILGAQEDCSIKPVQMQIFPHCQGKMQWMLEHWTTDPCYAEFGVDGTECSIRVFLSEIENWCPLLPGRTRKVENETTKHVKVAEMNFDLPSLLKNLANPGTRPNYDWIRERVTRMWSSWVKAGKALQNKYNMTGRPQKKILIHMGFLSQKSGFKMVENSDRGGPLGELVQWSDIISSLHILGHEISITSEFEQLTVILDKLPRASQQCQTLESLPMDMIFSDIVGLTQFRKKVRNGFGKFSCLLRVMDSFGTEPAYNFDIYAKANKKKTAWGMQNLDLRQFFTMFPHSPDNSFMGFVVENHLNQSQVLPAKKNQAVVYGKAEYMWLGKESYLEEFRHKLEIHSTVYPTGGGVESIVPKYVRNHGILSGSELHRLLQQSKLFIGLGFPYEGPAPLEAIAHGCVFINPKFIPPHSSHNTKFFQGKPTSRQVTSQHPYAEMFIGEPHVYTVDIDDKTQLKAAIDKALTNLNQNKVEGFMPYEFTQEGMLQRVSAYITHQDFCDPRPKLWPPASDITFHVAKNAQSCANACWDRELVCEPSYFKTLNSREELERHLGRKCLVMSTKEEIYFPAWVPDTQECILQSQPMLYSCVGEVQGLQRVCPCRTFIKQQTALCKACL